MGHDGGGYMIRIIVEAEQIAGEHLTLTSQQAHYLFRVMRAGSGTSFEAIVSGDKIFRCVSTKDELVAKCMDMRMVSVKSGLFLAQALLKKDLFSQIVTRGTEAGISRFYPLVTDRTIVREISDTKWRRWHAIAKEATEQSQRVRVPEISQLISLQDLVGVKIPCKVMLDPHGRNIWDWVNARPKDPPFECLLVVGPEGGFSESERQQMIGHGFEAISLGSHVYRAENAGVIAAALLETWQDSTERTRRGYIAYPQLAQDGDDF